MSASAPRLGLDEMLAAEESGTTFMLDIKGHDTLARMKARYAM